MNVFAAIRVIFIDAESKGLIQYIRNVHMFLFLPFTYIFVESLQTVNCTDKSDF